MKNNFNRRDFIKTAAVTGVGLGMTGSISSLYGKTNPQNAKRVGIIGLDTSHSIAFVKALNAASPDPVYKGYRVVAAYPKGSNDIESSVSRIPGYTDQVKEMGVEIVGSIADLLKKVDVVLLETNDGRLHYEQALPVLKAGKRLFIDKPISASLSDAIAIFNASEKYKVPVFSCSSLRFMESAQEVAKGKVGKVLGADTYSPASLEKTHPDFFWYGIHGVEILFTVMGLGCESVVRVHTEGTDIAIGTWDDGRVGTFRGTRTGKHTYGGIIHGEKGDVCLGEFGGYGSLLSEIITFFETGKVPVNPADTIEICAFMEAADESKRQNGAPVKIADVMQNAMSKLK